jgi:hypothetical protein
MSNNKQVTTEYRVQLIADRIIGAALLSIMALSVYAACGLKAVNAAQTNSAIVACTTDMECESLNPNTTVSLEAVNQ